MRDEDARMVKCGECYGEVDERAGTCPHCGEGMKGRNDTLYGLSAVCGGLGLLALLSFPLFGWASLVTAFFLLVGAMAFKQ